jgi:hypothetical protein
MRFSAVRIAAPLVLALMFTAHTATADRLLIERVRESQAVPMPKRGATMDQVRAQFGEPLESQGPVGQPPITTWRYHDISVYFEKKWVINSVVNKARESEKGPRPAPPQNRDEPGSN